jgi:hypothetical protein
MAFLTRSNRILGVAFVCVLVAGTIGTAISMIADRSSFPAVSSWKKIPSRFETFLNDHIAGRTSLLDLGARVRIDSLGTSPTPRVWIGSEGMLFYNHRVDLAAEYVGEAAEEQCVRHWAALTRARRDWCEARGIPFVMIVVPDKQSVYAELLPPMIRHRQSDSVLDRLIELCKTAPTIRLLDLRADLRAAKTEFPTYRLSDTHWTPFGCWRGYSRAVEALSVDFPNVVPRPWSQLQIEVAPFSGGDTWRLLGLSRPPPVEEYPCFRLLDSKATSQTQRVDLHDEDRLGHLRPVVWTNPTANGPHIVLFGDSFIDRDFQELLAQHCQRLVIVPTFEMIESIIEQERPDAVIFETVERSILATRPRLPKSR